MHGEHEAFLRAERRLLRAGVTEHVSAAVAEQVSSQVSEQVEAILARDGERGEPVLDQDPA